MAGSALLSLMGPAAADDAGLAKQLSNPVASLISVPFQFNYDTGFGPDEGSRVLMNFQPVVPISISEDWNLISRTILPVVWQNDLARDTGTQFGLGDTTESLFLSPKEPGPGGIIWGLGPIFLLPTGTDKRLGGDQWGAGPTGVALKQSGPWTFGVLANQIWSFAGDESRNDVNSTFMQPFISYTTTDAWTFALKTESTYDWTAGQWSVPINLMVSKLLTVGQQPVSLQTGLRYWADSPENGPEGFGARFAVVFLFPKK